MAALVVALVIVIFILLRRMKKILVPLNELIKEEQLKEGKTMRYGSVE